MPNVICILEPEQHLALKAEARRNFRTLGNQLLAMAFGATGLPRPPARHRTAAGSISTSIAPAAEKEGSAP